MTNSIHFTNFKPGTVVVFEDQIYIVLNFQQFEKTLKITYLSNQDVFVVTYDPKNQDSESLCYNVL